MKDKNIKILFWALIGVIIGVMCFYLSKDEAYYGVVKSVIIRG